MHTWCYSTTIILLSMGIENTALAMLSQQLESEKKMSHRIQKYEQELKERDHKGILHITLFFKYPKMT